MAKPLNESFHEGSHNNLFILLIIIAIVTTTRIILLLISELNLHGDEAQYWSWSQDLDWGYFTKPPLLLGRFTSPLLFLATQSGP
ncbi:MAG: hypothetical protein CM15mP62_12100 [Rhodospirillaceae bacterium]|nr:MAG: hypothetical protein CM15mP62_12100 [Rhodospirillaceae bacterium]